MKVFNTVNSIPKEAVDSIAPDSCFTKEWFKILETTKTVPGEPRYIVDYDKDKLISFAPCFIDKTGYYFYYGPTIFPLMRRFLNMQKKIHLSKNDFLLCHSPFSFRSKISIEEKNSKNPILNNLTMKIDEICKQEKIPFSSFLFVSEFDKTLSKHLENAGYCKSYYTNSMNLDIEWETFEDYLASLTYNNRHRVRKEMKKFKKRGLVIEQINDFKGISEILHKLSSNLFSKHQTDAVSPYKPFFFDCVFEYAKDQVRLFVVKKDEKIVGYCICLQHNDSLDMFNCGFDYKSLDKSDVAYFNVVYYEPIKWAIQNGIKKMYYRTSTEKAKLRRGCKSEKLYSFIKCHNTIVNSQLQNCLKIMGKRARTFPSPDSDI